MILTFRSFVMIIFTALIAYYPVFFAEVCLLDDRNMLSSLSEVECFDLIGTFFPQSHAGLYFRPMIAFSFQVDRLLWNLDPTIMHFENIVLHLTSSFLIFLIARLKISQTSKLPFFAAFIFAVLPIATESVSWISGRTDLLAVMFILSSLYSVLLFKKSNKYLHLTSSIVLLVLGVLAKETAIAFIPAVMFILNSKNSGVLHQLLILQINKIQIIVFCSICSLSLVSALLFYNYYLPVGIVFLYFFYLQWCMRERDNGTALQKVFVQLSGTFIALWAVSWGVRTVAFTTQSPHILRTFNLLFADMNHTLSLFFGAAGFYFKKFVYPFPLNFVIRDISPFYSLLGIFLLCIVVVLIVRRQLPDTLIIAGFCMIVPVMPLIFESIAWTSYAERYVYPAAPFWILALAFYSDSAGFDRISLRTSRLCIVGLSLLIFISASATFQRNQVWQTNLALFKDSVEKTPTYKPVRGLYMTALYEKGLYDEALQQYHIAQSLQTIPIKYNPNYELFYVQLLMLKNRFVEAEQELDRIFGKTKGNVPEVYEISVELASRMLLEKNDAAEYKRLKIRLSDAYDKWYELTKDPMLLYRKGQFLLAQNDRKEAGKLFGKAAILFPVNNLFHNYSVKLANSLNNE
ncbi:MAG: glycosyltransferase family 39 protein [Desulfuromonadaceae bacterium]